MYVSVKKFIQNIKNLPVKTKSLLGLGIVLALAVALPLFVWAVLTQRLDLRKRASSAEPVATFCGGITGAICSVGYVCVYDDGTTRPPYPDASGTCQSRESRTTPPPTADYQPAGSVSWVTPNAFFQASNFYILLNGQYYYAPGATYEATADSSNFNQTVLTATWQESSRQMKMELTYLQDPQANTWQVTRIRTFDGATWVEYHDYYYNTVGNSIGQAYVNNSPGAFISDNTSGGIKAIYFLSMNTGAFGATPVPLPTPTASPSGSFCGGIAGIACPTGYVCVYGNGTRRAPNPDASGTCQIFTRAVPTATATSTSQSYVGECGTCTNNQQCATGFYCAEIVCNEPGGCQGTCQDIYLGSNCNGTTPPTLTPSPSPAAATRSMEFKIKLKGVSGGLADGAKVVIGFLSRALPTYSTIVTSPLTLHHIGNGVYQALLEVPSAQLPAASNYTIYVKGEKHLSTKFCLNEGQTQRCSGADGFITIPEATANLATQVFDFTGLSLEPGDLYPQDGRADINDFNRIKDLMKKTCSSLTEQEKLTADLNYDGCVTVLDAALMRRTLETRYDE